MRKVPDDKIESKLRKASMRLRVLEEGQLSFSNSKQSFQYENKRIRGHDSISVLKVDGRTVTADEEKANLFSKFFASVFVRCSLISRYSPCSPSPEFPDQRVKFTNEGIALKIKSLKGKFSFTPDGIPPIFYKKVGDFITEPLRLIFERSYEDGVVPSVFRESVVTPVHKKGSRDCMDNYRPVAQCSIACILFEKLLIDHINAYLEINSIGDSSQHGFTKGLSTETQLIQTIHDWSLRLNSGDHFICVYFDFSKAFDRVDHRLLVHKLCKLGLHQNTINWVSSYLTNHSFKVRMNSRALKCPSGVPQGSCLGPLLFRLFLLDLQTVIPPGVVHKLFADDLKIYNSENSYDLLLLQNAIDNISEWCEQNGMLISVPKCAVLSSCDQPCNLTLNNASIPIVKVFKDLGVLVSSSLDFSDHRNAVIKKAFRISSLIFRAFAIKKPEFYIQLYKSLVQPLLLYCSTIWTPYKGKDIQALESVRNRFIRRLARRCNVSKSSISLQPVMDLHREADIRMFHRLSALGIAENLFDIDANNLRSCTTIRTLQVAKTEKINHLYTFRLPSIIR